LLNEPSVLRLPARTPSAKIIIIAFLYPPCAADKKAHTSPFESKEIIELKKAHSPLP